VALEALGGDGIEVPAALVAVTEKCSPEEPLMRGRKKRDKKIVKSRLALGGYSRLKVAVRMDTR
jgi:hypothetical protein